jgi:hypothetical protein
MTLYQYFGSGSLGTLSALSESKTYTYNISSIFNNLEDYQSITISSGFTDDFGEISQVSGLTVDFNLITDIVSGNVEPFGGLTLSGSANTEWINKNYYGSGEYKVVYSPDNTSGTLFSFGEKLESITYDYSESSVEDTLVDYGLISNYVIFTDDFGEISQVSGLTVDFNLITDIVSGNVEPFGGLTLSGSSSNNPIVVYQDYITSGTIIELGTLLERSTNSYSGSGNIDLGKNAVNICGESNQLSSTATTFDSTLETFDNLCSFIKLSSALESFTPATEIASGTLFSFGEKIESRTYDYNESSVEDTSIDYGLISNTTVLFEDYQNIINVSEIVEDFNLITVIVSNINQPFGGLTLSGSALTQPNYRLFLSGQAIVKTSYIPEITYGTLFGFGEKLESITYDYNSSSIYENSLDYGSITSPQLGGPDYGVITGSSGNNPSENYGLITETIEVEVSTPFGLSLLYGSAITSEIATYTKVASGTITLSGSSLERFAADTPEDTQLFTIFGSAIERDNDSYIGSGTLVKFGEKLESVTYDYSEESITINSLDDFGSVSVGYTISTDCGLIVGAIDGGIDNYGLLVGNPFASTPFGSILISGSALESFG